MFYIPSKFLTISCSFVSGREILCFQVFCPLSSRLTFKLMSGGSVWGGITYEVLGTWASMWVVGCEQGRRAVERSHVDSEEEPSSQSCLLGCWWALLIVALTSRD